MFDKNLQLILEDGQHTIFLNSMCRNNVPAELEGFYHYLQTGEVTEGDEWLAEMAAAVEDANNRKEVLNDVTVYDEIEMLEKMLKEAKQEYEVQAEELAAKGQELEAKDQELEAKNRFSSLTLLLARQGRTEDILRAAEDEEYRNKLMIEFNI